MVITPALLLPLRFVNTLDIDDSFDGDFAQAQPPYWKMGEKCYLQKYQRSDNLTLQLISDEPLTDLLVLNENGAIVQTIEWTASELTLEPPYSDFIIYEIDYPLNSLAEGVYIFQQDNFEAQAIDLRDDQPNTLLVEYTNSENDNDVVFDTGIVFQFRFEGGIDNYTPKNNREVYVNQIQNPTQLKSVAYRQFTLYVGFQSGVPEWILDKVNIITQCDEVLYNGIQYQPTADGDIEIVRADDLVTFVGGRIEVEPTNKIIKFVTGKDPQQITIRIVRRSKDLESISGNQTIAGVFNQRSALEKIVIYKSGVDYTLRVGTTPNGNEISEFLVNSNTGYTQVISYTFTGEQTIYLSGTGLNADWLSLVYDQLDAPEVPINATATDEIGKGTVAQWTGSEADLNLAFDTITGLGKPNTKFVKWCIAGSNGTPNYNESYIVGIGPGGDYSEIGEEVGANNKAITKSFLPASGLPMFTADAGTDNTNMNDTTKIAFSRSVGSQPANYVMVKGNQSNTISVGTTANMGDGNNFNVQPKSIKTLVIVKIVD